MFDVICTILLMVFLGFIITDAAKDNRDQDWTKWAISQNYAHFDSQSGKVVWDAPEPKFLNDK